MKRKGIFVPVIPFLLLALVFSAFAEAPDGDAEGNLAEFGLTPDGVLREYTGADGETSPATGLYQLYLDGRATFAWFDVTGDGCVDLCTGRMFGSGMVRLETVVYDPVARESYILDGYNYDFLIGGVSEGRLVIVKKGPNGYGDPVAETRGTVLLAGERLLFMADHQPVVLGTEEPFDVSLAAVPSGEAVRTAEKFAVEYLDVKYFNEVTVDAAASDGNSRFCWAVSFSWSGQQECIVYVNTETGEVENSFIPDEGQG